MNDFTEKVDGLLKELNSAIAKNEAGKFVDAFGEFIEVLSKCVTEGDNAAKGSVGGLLNVEFSSTYPVRSEDRNVLAETMVCVVALFMRDLPLDAHNDLPYLTEFREAFTDPSVKSVVLEHVCSRVFDASGTPLLSDSQKSEMLSQFSRMVTFMNYEADGAVKSLRASFSSMKDPIRLKGKHLLLLQFLYDNDVSFGALSKRMEPLARVAIANCSLCRFLFLDKWRYVKYPDDRSEITRAERRFLAKQQKTHLWKKWNDGKEPSDLQLNFGSKDADEGGKSGDTGKDGQSDANAVVM